MHRELPVRTAHRIVDFRSLPFIVGCNPTILAVHNMYLKSFRRLTEEPPVETLDDEMRFSNLLRTILNEHSSVISMLATGFRECRSRIPDANLITDFLNRTLTSRMATRLLAEHHLALRENRPHHVGIIDQRMALTDVVKKQIELVSGMFQLEYGMAPEVILAGQTDLVFPYIRIPLDYILTELFKNAFRATIESKCRTAGKLPPIYVTLASDEVDFWIRITDHAGGIPSDLEHAIWEYHVSTPAAAKVEAGWERASTKHGSHSVVKEPNVLPPPTATGGALGPHARLSSQSGDIDLPLNVGASSQILPSNKIFCSITQHQVTKSIHGSQVGNLCFHHSELGKRWFGMRNTWLNQHTFGCWTVFDPHCTTKHSFSNCLVADLPASAHTSYSSETMVVEDLNLSQFSCSKRLRLTAIQQSSPYSSVMHTSLDFQGYAALTPQVSQINRRDPGPGVSCVGLVCPTTVGINTTSKIRKTLRNFQCIPLDYSDSVCHCREPMRVSLGVT
ncbi:hypothetical protein CRM22_002288 [Opisthorchis felineus]|nr:hypothetical protein CRM22_002288 [Opisthorchis felineus]